MLLCVMMGAFCTHRQAEGLQDKTTEAMCPQAVQGPQTTLKSKVKAPVTTHKRKDACSAYFHAGLCWRLSKDCTQHVKLTGRDLSLRVALRTTFEGPKHSYKCMTVRQYAQQPYKVMRCPAS